MQIQIGKGIIIFLLLYRFKVLDITDGIDEPGGLKWDITLCLLLAWIIVFACIAKGVKTSGKVR